MINSPIYAGVYVYGRRLTGRMGVRAADGRAGSRRRTARREECLAWIEDALPAYISLARYEANLVRLKANRAHCDVPERPVRAGAAGRAAALWPLRPPDDRGLPRRRRTAPD